MSFRHLVGHQHVTALLARAVRRESLPPSLIFEGPEGVGKHTTALALAQALNCLEPRIDTDDSVHHATDSCGACSACDRIRRNAHPDILTLAPAESGAIKIDVVRDVIERSAYRPFEGRKRVVIVDRADALVPAAQSALLKTLEEPSRSSVFVLVTARPDVLLATVRSRCPRLRFGRLTAGEIAEALIRSHGYSKSDAMAVASTSGGSLGRALDEASDELQNARQAAHRFLVVAAQNQAPKQLLAGAVDLAKGTGARAGAGRELVARRLRALASLVRDLAVCVSRANRDLIVNRDLADELDGLTGAFDQPRLTRGFLAIARALQALDRNASPKVVADWLALQL
jgi:DNA polymerase-3 subunit delta'